MQVNKKDGIKKYKNDGGSDFELPSESLQQDICDNQSECLKREKKLKIKLRKQRIYKKMNRGSWSIEQELRFLTFLKENQNIFQDKQQRRSCKIFKKMRSFIKTRSHEQCRSHHQKYEQRFLEFDKIICHLENKVKDQHINSQKSQGSYVKPFRNIQNKLIPFQNEHLSLLSLGVNKLDVSLNALNLEEIASPMNDNYPPCKEAKQKLKPKKKIRNTDLQDAEQLMMTNFCKLFYTQEKIFILQVDLEEVDSL